MAPGLPSFSSLFQKCSSLHEMENTLINDKKHDLATLESSDPATVWAQRLAGTMCK
jgi:hypothetical protein